MPFLSPEQDNFFFGKDQIFTDLQQNYFTGAYALPIFQATAESCYEKS